MKTSLIILSIFSVLGLGLFFSNQFEETHYASEITAFRCEQINYLPFPYEYIYDKKNSSLYKTRRLDKLFSHKSVNWFNTELAGLPDDVFENYSCIESIHLSNNHFTAIPDAIKKTPHLKSLYMSNNQLEELDLRAINFSRENISLKNIYLSNNSIKRVLGIPGYPINTLDLKNNQIEAFGVYEDGSQCHDYFRGKDETTNIDLSHNHLKDFPSVFYRELPAHVTQRL